jgi:hypothetical protein
VTEPEPGLEEVERELDARGLLLQLDEVAPGEWRASAQPKGPALAGEIPSATGAGRSRLLAASALLQALVEEERAR